MQISPIQQNQNPNFQGKFIEVSHFGNKEKNIIKDFINYSYKGKTNGNILRKKPYDIYCVKEKDNIVLNTVYNVRHSERPEPCFISFLDENLEKSTVSFRSSLNWFSSFKKDHGYFNGFWEKLRTIFS